jgi:hypothetical protein
MIKKLVFMAALLMPSLAYGANPTADLSVQIVPAVSAPAVPLPAQAAGFTTLAANYDFTQPFYATQSNWLGCKPLDGNDHQWFQGGVITGNPPSPCSAIRQANDPLTGQPVLNMTWLPSYHTNADNNYTTGIQTVNDDLTHGVSWPFGYYEFIYRVSRTGANGLTAAWTSPLNFNPENGIEYDTIEVFYSSSLTDSCYHNWSNGNDVGCNWFPNTPSNLSNFDATQYHKYAMRVSGDGRTAIYFCSYVDDIAQGCQRVNTTAAQLAGQRNFIQLNVGINCVVPCNNAFQEDMYVKSVRVWSCSNWQGSSCPTSSANP